MTRIQKICGAVLLTFAVSMPVARAESPDVLLFKAQMTLAKRGDPSAQYYLGEMYEQGLGTEQNLSEAFKWYEMAAKRGNRLAQRKIEMRKRIMAQHEKERAEEKRADDIAAAQAAEKARAEAIARARQQKLANDKAEAEARREAEKARAATLKQRAEAAARVRAAKLARIRQILQAQANRPEAIE